MFKFRVSFDPHLFDIQFWCHLGQHHARREITYAELIPTLRMTAAATLKFTILSIDDPEVGFQWWAFSIVDVKNVK
jgi:hypothetical protein